MLHDERGSGGWLRCIDGVSSFVRHESGPYRLLLLVIAPLDGLPQF
jgi:hypothetical protein